MAISRTNCHGIFRVMVQGQADQSWLVTRVPTKGKNPVGFMLHECSMFVLDPARFRNAPSQNQLQIPLGCLLYGFAWDPLGKPTRDSAASVETGLIMPTANRIFRSEKSTPSCAVRRAPPHAFAPRALRPQRVPGRAPTGARQRRRSARGRDLCGLRGLGRGVGGGAREGVGAGGARGPGDGAGGRFWVLGMRFGLWA